MTRNIVKQVICAIMLFLLLGCVTVSNDTQPVEVAHGETTQLAGIESNTPETVTQVVENVIENTVEEPVQTQSLEAQEEKQAILQDEETLLQKFLKETPEGYWYFNVDDFIGGRVYGFNRASGSAGPQDKYAYTYWSPDTSTAYVFFGELTTTEIEFARSNAKEYKPKSLRDQTTKPAYIEVERAEEYPLSPIDWMQEYQYAKPFLVETATTTVTVGRRYYTSDYRLHFNNGDGTTTILTLDSKYHVPVKVDVKREQEYLVHEYYYFDTSWYNVDSNFMLRGKVTEQVVNLPENSEVLTQEQASKVLEIVG